ncbi:hypothetical protein [Aeromicrobium sp. UC242_57]|uniref:hypothetical protein n=1 Tax=Aeromicrobium sp. UC242_57 TaxID=3374624 RepID=UPI0037AFF573
MSDIRTLLHEAADAAETTTTVMDVDADLVRARRALRRRRTSRLSAGSGLVAAAALGTFVVVGTSGSPTVPAPSVASAPQGGVTEVALVAYTGAQPEGFVLDKVPAGWEVRASTAGALILAPVGSADQGTTEGSTSLEGTIAVMTQSDTGVPSGVQLDDVRVGNRPGVIAHMKGTGDTRTLFVEQPSGAYLVVQVWDGLGWDNARIAEFGASVHVTKDAVESFG